MTNKTVQQAFTEIFSRVSVLDSAVLDSASNTDEPTAIDRAKFLKMINEVNAVSVPTLTTQDPPPAEDLDWEEAFTMNPKPAGVGWFTDPFTVTFDMTNRIEFDASGKITHYNWDEIKAEIAGTTAFAGTDVTDAIASQAILADLNGTGDASNCTLPYADYEHYALVYDTVKPFHKGLAVEHLSQTTWAINYYTSAGDYNSKFSTVVCGVIENNKYVVKTITSDAVWGTLRNVWTPVNGLAGNLIAYAMSGTLLQVAETATVNVFPPSTLDLNAYDLTTFPSDIAGMSLYYSPGPDYDATKYPVGVEVSPEARLLLDKFAGFLGFPDPSGSESWESQWATFASQTFSLDEMATRVKPADWPPTAGVVSTNADGTYNVQAWNAASRDLQRSRILPVFNELLKFGESIQLLFYLVRIYFAGETGGAGTSYARSVLREDSNIGIDGIVQRLADSAAVLQSYFTTDVNGVTPDKFTTLPGGGSNAWNSPPGGDFTGTYLLEYTNYGVYYDRFNPNGTRRLALAPELNSAAEIGSTYEHMINMRATPTFNSS